MLRFFVKKTTSFKKKNLFKTLIAAGLSKLLKWDKNIIKYLKNTLKKTIC